MDEKRMVRMKSSQEIMNEIEESKINKKYFITCKLKAQRQERLECYKKELEFLEDNFDCFIEPDESWGEGRFTKKIGFLKQEIRILEGEK